MKKPLCYLALFAATTTFAASSAATHAIHQAQAPTPSEVSATAPQPDLSHPLYQDDQIKTWASDTARGLFNYDYQNYQDSLENIAKRFSPAGWISFMKALRESGNLDAMIKNKMTVTATAGDQVKILSQQVVDGRYQWHVQLPLLPTYHNEKDQLKTPVLISFTIERVDTATNPEGIVVNNLLVKPTSG